MCMDDMIVKFKEKPDHVTHLKEVFTEVKKYKKRLNLEKLLGFTSLKKEFRRTPTSEMK